MIIALMLALAANAEPQSCDEGLLPIGASRGWLVYITPDNRILLEATTPGRADGNVAAAIAEAFAQRAAREHILRNDT